MLCPALPHGLARQEISCIVVHGWSHWIYMTTWNLFIITTLWMCVCVQSPAVQSSQADCDKWSNSMVSTTLSLSLSPLSYFYFVFLKLEMALEWCGVMCCPDVFCPRRGTDILLHTSPTELSPLVPSSSNIDATDASPSHPFRTRNDIDTLSTLISFAQPTCFCFGLIRFGRLGSSSRTV